VLLDDARCAFLPGNGCHPPEACRFFPDAPGVGLKDFFVHAERPMKPVADLSLRGAVGEFTTRFLPADHRDPAAVVGSAPSRSCRCGSRRYRPRTCCR